MAEQDVVQEFYQEVISDYRNFYTVLYSKLGNALYGMLNIQRSEPMNHIMLQPIRQPVINVDETISKQDVYEDIDDGLEIVLNKLFAYAVTLLKLFKAYGLEAINEQGLIRLVDTVRILDLESQNFMFSSSNIDEEVIVDITEKDGVSAKHIAYDLFSIHNQIRWLLTILDIEEYDSEYVKREHAEYTRRKEHLAHEFLSRVKAIAHIVLYKLEKAIESDLSKPIAIIFDEFHVLSAQSIRYPILAYSNEFKRMLFTNRAYALMALEPNSAYQRGKVYFIPIQDKQNEIVGKVFEIAESKDEIDTVKFTESNIRELIRKILVDEQIIFYGKNGSYVFNRGVLKHSAIITLDDIKT